MSIHSLHEKIPRMLNILVFMFLEDRPLVVQFAAKNASEFADAAEIVAP